MTTKKIKLTPADEQILNRNERFLEFSEGRGPMVKSTTRAKLQARQEPVTTGMGRRSDMSKLTWLPFSQRVVSTTNTKDAARVIDPKLVSVKLENNADYIGTYHNYTGVVRLEYDMMEPFVIYDTEVFVKQAITRKLALMFRNGFELVSEMESEVDQGQKNVDYIQKRLDVMEYVTNTTTENFFRDILFSMLLCSNCFLRKIRDAKASPGQKGENNGKREPIAGYTIIPAHEIQPVLLKGKIDKWRRYFTNGAMYEDISPSDIVHLKWDSKPGHIAGTPRTVGVRDDIFALRRLEENIELLFVNYLFPLFHVKVGSDKNPAWYGPNGQSEIDIIKYSIENMPKEGVFVTDERCEVASVGSEGQALDTKELVAHLKGRVLTGLGVSPLDVGEGDTANRSTADNISQVLKDAIKSDLDVFRGLLRMFFFKDWFEEANYSVSIQKAVTTTDLVFHEIDLDNKIKSENHTLNKFNNHLITEDEARKELKRPPVDNKARKGLHFDLHVVRLVKETAQAKSDAEIKTNKELLPLEAAHQEKLAETQKGLLGAQTKHAQAHASAAEVKAAAQVKVLHAKTRHAIAIGQASPSAASAGKKGVQNRNTPTNQHGSNPGPTKAKSSRVFIELVKDRLSEARDLFSTDTTGRTWSEISGEAIDSALSQFADTEIGIPDESSYTNQLRTKQVRLKHLVALTDDPELLTVLLDGYEDVDANEELNDVGTEIESGIAGEEDQSAGTVDIDPSGSGDSEPLVS